MKKKEEEKEANNERWLLTYSDLITLLMIFFVIMYASSNVDTKKYEQLVSSFNIAMGSGSQSNGDNIISKGGVPSIINGNSQEKPQNESKGKSESKDGNGKGNILTEHDKLMNMKEKVDIMLKDNKIDNTVSTTIEERGLIISLKDTLLFDSGKADLKKGSIDKLISLGRILNGLENYIRVEGHTDIVPINNGQFSSNWELSVIRATNVTQLLVEKSGINPKRLASVGYGEFRAVASNLTENGRVKNRRVDIIIMDSKFNQIENNKK